MARPTEGTLTIDKNGKIKTTGYKTPGIKRVNEKHKTVGRLVVKGLTYAEIGKKVGFSATHISRVVATPAVKNEMERYKKRLSESAIDKLIASTPKAADVLIDDLDIDGDDPRLRSLRQKAAIEVLHTGLGVTPESGGVINQQINVMNISTPDLMKEVLDLSSE